MQREKSGLSFIPIIAVDNLKFFWQLGRSFPLILCPGNKFSFNFKYTDRSLCNVRPNIFIISYKLHLTFKIWKMFCPLLIIYDNSWFQIFLSFFSSQEELTKNWWERHGSAKWNSVALCPVDSYLTGVCCASSFSVFSSHNCYIS